MQFALRIDELPDAFDRIEHALERPRHGHRGPEVGDLIGASHEAVDPLARIEEQELLALDGGEPP